MTPLYYALLTAAFLCSLLAGFLFAFAVVVMPGIRRLPDREFLRAFQEVDGVIQRGSPLFFVVWVGSTLSVVVAAGIGFVTGEGVTRWLLAAMAIAHVVGVQLPTMRINVPLNNALQATDLDTLDDAALADAREAFEPRWNRWNVARTWVASAVAAGLLLML